MAADLGTLFNAAKLLYGKRSDEQLNTGHKMIARLKKRMGKIEGYRFVHVLRTGRTNSVFAQFMRATFAQSAGVSKYYPGNVQPKINIGTYEANLVANQLMQMPASSFIDMISDGLEDLLEAKLKDLNRQVWGDGSGYLAKKTTGSDTTTPVDLTAHLWGGTTNPGVYLTDDLLVDVINTDKDTLRTTAGLTINGDSTTTMAFDAGTAASSDSAAYIGKYGTLYDASNADTEFSGQSAQKELSGLTAIVYNGDPICGALQGVAVASAPVWMSTYKDGSGGLNDQLLYDTWYDIVQACGDDKEPTELWSNYLVRGRWYGQLVPLMHFNVDRGSSLGKRDTFLKNDEHVYGAKWEADTDCPNGKLFYLNMNHLEIKQAKPMGFLEPGDHLLRVHGTLTGEAVLVWVSELCTDRRNVHGVIHSIPES